MGLVIASSRLSILLVFSGSEDFVIGMPVKVSTGDLLVNGMEVSVIDG